MSAYPVSGPPRFQYPTQVKHGALSWCCVISRWMDQGLACVYAVGGPGVGGEFEMLALPKPVNVTFTWVEMNDGGMEYMETMVRWAIDNQNPR